MHLSFKFARSSSMYCKRSLHMYKNRKMYSTLDMYYYFHFQPCTTMYVQHDVRRCTTMYKDLTRYKRSSTMYRRRRRKDRKELHKRAVQKCTVMYVTQKCAAPCCSAACTSRCTGDRRLTRLATDLPLPSLTLSLQKIISFRRCTTS